MSETAADVLVDTLTAWGVEAVFGIPGDGINGIMEALRRRKDEIRFVQTRHEEAAALAACGYAKFTGRLGVCLATSGPGGIHLLNGVYDAKLDGIPLLAITGLQFHDLMSTYTQQDVELDKLFMDACSYSARVMGPTHVQNVTELAIRTALAYRAPTHITVPVDIQSMPLKKSARSERNIADHLSHLMARGGQLPDPAQVRKAADVLNAGKKTVILAGRGALGAREELLQVAELLGAPVAMPLLGKGAVPDDSPYATGGAGLLGARPSQDALETCDTLLIAGSSFPYIEYYPRPGEARAVQIDIDPKRIGLRYPIEAGLVGDSAAVLRTLIPLLVRQEDRSFLETAQKGVAEWRAMLREQGGRRDSPMKPQVVTQALNDILADDAIVATDSGTVTAFTARYIDMRGDRQFSCSGTLASMAVGLPYAIGAAIAYPHRQVVAIVGDGAMSMLMGDLVTLRKYGLNNVRIVVLKNNTLGQIKWEQIVFLGNPEYGCELEPIDFVKVAEGCGVRGVAIDDPMLCEAQLRDAFASAGACVIEATIDPFEPPMPPKVEAKQALHLAQALAKGTPHRERIVLTLASDVVRQIV